MENKTRILSDDKMETLLSPTFKLLKSFLFGFFFKKKDSSSSILVMRYKLNILGTKAEVRMWVFRDMCVSVRKL